MLVKWANTQAWPIKHFAQNIDYTMKLKCQITSRNSLECRCIWR